MKHFLKSLCNLVLSILIVWSMTSVVLAKDEINLPKEIVVSVYDTGSSGYTQVSAIANAFLKKYGVRLRLMPSGTSIGRLMPLVQGKADVAFLANEVWLSSEAIYDFATPKWGPQDLRVSLGKPTSCPLFTAKDANIRTINDIKGKRVAWVVGNPTLNVKLTAQLACAGLTWDDVIKIDFPSYSSALRGLVQGTVDAYNGSTTASILYELEASPRGIYYVPFPPHNKECWDRMRKIVPFIFPYKETVGAGISKDNPIWMVGYKYPLVTFRADADPEFVYNFTKAMVETFDLYKNAVAGMEQWEVNLSGHNPADAPFHEGAIKYLKEIGVWTEEDQKLNDEKLAHLQKVKRAWDEFLVEAKQKDLKGEEFRNEWMKIHQIIE